MTENKIALVTGANRGLGLEISRQLAKLGMTVLMGSRNAEKGRAAAEKFLSDGLAVESVLLDVTCPEHIVAVRDRVEKKFGYLDILVNNAGMMTQDDRSSPNSVESVSSQSLRDTFQVNFFAPVELTQALLPFIRKSSTGRIVMVSSDLGSLTLHSDPGSGMADFKPFAYDASKTALNQFAVHLAAALAGTAIKVNSAHPGWVKTDLGTDEALLTVAEGAKTIVRLATLLPDGPSGKFFHLEEELPW